jgi:hypothetical protein
MVTVICSYCDATIREGKTDAPLRSHGICADCMRYFKPQWSGLSMDQYLARFSTPVLVVDAAGRIYATNEAMEAGLDRAESELKGLLGGDAMECEYARLPEGCGQTVHCKTCTIRNTVEQTLTTGEAVQGVPAYLNCDDGRLWMRISTRMEADKVVVVIEEGPVPTAELEAQARPL